MNNSPYIYLANNLAIDFVNTVLNQHEEVTDLLQSNSDLSLWAHGAGLNIDTQLESFNLMTALELRTAFKDSFTAKINNHKIPKKSLETVNKHLLNHSVQQILHLENNCYVLQAKNKKLTFSKFLGYLAHEAATLLASPQAEQVKRCCNENCILIFLDTSRSHKRRWCSMDICGNRAKAAKHYKKIQS